MLSIIASHLSARQRGEQQPLQPGPDGGDSAVGATQLGSAVQGWEVAWEDINVEQLVGRGAFGMVYMGRWNELPVAVKVLVVIGEHGGWQGAERWRPRARCTLCWASLACGSPPQCLVRHA